MYRQAMLGHAEVGKVQKRVEQIDSGDSDAEENEETNGNGVVPGSNGRAYQGKALSLRVGAPKTRLSNAGPSTNVAASSKGGDKSARSQMRVLKKTEPRKKMLPDRLDPAFSNCDRFANGNQQDLQRILQREITEVGQECVTAGERRKNLKTVILRNSKLLKELMRESSEIAAAKAVPKGQTEEDEEAAEDEVFDTTGVDPETRRILLRCEKLQKSVGLLRVQREAASLRLEAAHTKHRGDAASAETLDGLMLLKLDLRKQLVRDKATTALKSFQSDNFVTGLEREVGELEEQAKRKEQKVLGTREQLTRIKEGNLERSKDYHMLQIELDELVMQRDIS
jgi:hypothetical protein